MQNQKQNKTRTINIRKTKNKIFEQCKINLKIKNNKLAIKGINNSKLEKKDKNMNGVYKIECEECNKLYTWEQPEGNSFWE